MEDGVDEGSSVEVPGKLADRDFRAGHLMFSPSAVVFAFSDEHRQQAARCLSDNGEIKISFKDISVTDLSHIRQLNGDDGVAVD